MTRNTMTKTTMVIGLNSQMTEKQEISTDEAKNLVSELLIEGYGFIGLTMTECEGVYKMKSTGDLIYEKSLKIELVTDEDIDNINVIIKELKYLLDQESIMVEVEHKRIAFL